MSFIAQRELDQQYNEQGLDHFREKAAKSDVGQWWLSQVGQVFNPVNMPVADTPASISSDPMDADDVELIERVRAEAVALRRSGDRFGQRVGDAIGTLTEEVKRLNAQVEASRQITSLLAKTLQRDALDVTGALRAAAALEADPAPRATEDRCGSRAVGGPCVLPRAHNMGNLDIPTNHAAGSPATVTTTIHSLRQSQLSEMSEGTDRA